MPSTTGQNSPTFTPINAAPRQQVAEPAPDNTCQKTDPPPDLQRYIVLRRTVDGELGVNKPLQFTYHVLRVSVKSLNPLDVDSRLMKIRQGGVKDCSAGASILAWGDAKQTEWLSKRNCLLAFRQQGKITQIDLQYLSWVFMAIVFSDADLRSDAVDHVMSKGTKFAKELLRRVPSYNMMLARGQLLVAQEMARIIAQSQAPQESKDTIPPPIVPSTAVGTDTELHAALATDVEASETTTSTTGVVENAVEVPQQAAEQVVERGAEQAVDQAVEQVVEQPQSATEGHPTAKPMKADKGLYQKHIKSLSMKNRKEKFARKKAEAHMSPKERRARELEQQLLLSGGKTAARPSGENTSVNLSSESLSDIDVVMENEESLFIPEEPATQHYGAPVVPAMVVDTSKTAADTTWEVTGLFETIGLTEDTHMEHADTIRVQPLDAASSDASDSDADVIQVKAGPARRTTAGLRIGLPLALPEHAKGKRAARDAAPSDSPSPKRHVNKKGIARRVNKTKTRVAAKKAASSASASSGDEAVEYEVESILDDRKDEDGNQEYYVKWRGYSEAESTWEPEEHLAGASVLVAEYRSAYHQDWVGLSVNEYDRISVE